MILYHGSNKELDVVKKSQAQKGEGAEVPKEELLDAIYLTSEYSFAIAMATRVEGVTNIDNEKKIIEFENPESFDPNEDIYIYEIDTENIPEQNLRQVDERQYIVEGIKELKISAVHQLKAEELLRYYEIKDLGKENKQEVDNFNQEAKSELRRKRLR